jgi:hypothetical protein
MHRFSLLPRPDRPTVADRVATTARLGARGVGLVVLCRGDRTVVTDPPAGRRQPRLSNAGDLLVAVGDQSRATRSSRPGRGVSEAVVGALLAFVGLVARGTLASLVPCSGLAVTVDCSTRLRRSGSDVGTTGIDANVGRCTRDTHLPDVRRPGHRRCAGRGLLACVRGVRVGRRRWDPIVLGSGRRAHRLGPAAVRSGRAPPLAAPTRVRPRTAR